MYSHSYSSHRKLFGDSASDSAKKTKRIHLNSRTTYQLMMKQKRPANSGTGEGEQQVRPHLIHKGPHC